MAWLLCRPIGHILKLQELAVAATIDPDVQKMDQLLDQQSLLHLLRSFVAYEKQSQNVSLGHFSICDYFRTQYWSDRTENLDFIAMLRVIHTS